MTRHLFGEIVEWGLIIFIVCCAAYGLLWLGWKIWVERDL